MQNVFGLKTYLHTKYKEEILLIPLKFFQKTEEEERSSHSSQTREGVSNWKGRSKIVTICRWHDTLYRNPRDSTQKVLELINEFSKIVYEINIKKSIVFLYTNHEVAETINKQYLLKLHQKLKYLEINLSNKVKYLYAENHKTSIKDIKDDSKK